MWQLKLKIGVVHFINYVEIILTIDKWVIAVCCFENKHIEENEL